MAAEWPKTKRLIGQRLPRVDGPLKSTGRSRYTLDINRPNMLHGTILRSPHAHAKIKAIDTSALEKMPGVKAFVVIAGPGKEVFYAGDEILALAAETEEQAHDALRSVKVDFDELEFFVNEEEALAGKIRTVGGKGNNNLSKPQTYQKGDVAEAFKNADATVEGTYGVNVICHQ